MLMVVTLKQVIINKLKRSMLQSLLKGQRLVEHFYWRWNEMNKLLHPSKSIRALLFKATREIEGLLLRDYY